LHQHFAANNQESNRGSINVIVSERALREIYLRGFEIAVKGAQPWTVMSSYNTINGVYTSESHDLLTKILRNEWGFKGYVMTDWFGGRDPLAQMNAGNDLIEPGSKSKSTAIINAVKNGTLDIKVLDQNVERILNIVVQTPAFQKYRYSNLPDLKGHAALARAAAAESMVLLKNEQQVLPIQKGLKLALYGNASYDTYIGGTGSGQVNTSYKVSVAEGLLKAGYTTDEVVKESYTKHIQEDLLSHPKPKMALGTPRITPELELTEEAIQKSAVEAGVAVFTLGRNAGEGGDRKVAEDFNLTSAEQKLLKKVADAFHAKGKKVVVIINVGGIIETASWRDHVDAILLAWQPGLEGGNAIADVLSGRVNPSGKLATTFPIRYEDVPSAKNFPGTPAENPKEVRY
jgi:beta-glucosidase